MTQDLNIFSRAELLLGEETLHKLRSARVALFGIGGVGSFAAEALARGGVGHITLVDGDTVSITNINRQLIALHSSMGRKIGICWIFPLMITSLMPLILSPAS